MGNFIGYPNSISYGEYEVDVTDTLCRLDRLRRYVLASPSDLSVLTFLDAT